MPGLIETLGQVARGAARGAVASYEELRRAGNAQPTGGAGATAVTHAADVQPKSVMLDPYGMVASMGYRERNAAISYYTLQALVYRAPVIASIIQTRCNQVSSFARPQPNKYATGYRVMLRDKNAKPSRAATKFAQKQESLIHQTGIGQNPRGREGFASYLKKLTRDTLTLGHDATEIVPNRRGEPAEFFAVDAKTIRIADTDRINMAQTQAGQVAYVQIYDGVIISEYTQDEMAFGIRNPVSDIRSQGYGIGELEMLVETVTNLINTWDYNANFFKNGSAPKGMINFKGTVSGEMVAAFRRHWYAMLQGVDNAWRTPIGNASEGVEWVPMQMNNKDMEMSAFNEVLIKAACGVFAIDPAEINFSFGNQGQTQSMGSQDNNEKVVHSQERGLRPLLSHFANTINTHIIWPIDQDFHFTFMGLDAMTRDQSADLNTKQVKSYRTIDEVRADDDLEPLPDKKGEVILDPTYMQFVAMSQQAAMGPDQSMGAPQPFNGGAQGSDTDADDDVDDDETQKSDRLLSACGPRILIPGMKPIQLPESFAKASVYDHIGEH
ncbi:MAG: phage portal protein [Deltaproteobacteria bacterium]|nr:MAG: phage portal protein [Deltaproteobacteria bacterium]